MTIEERIELAIAQSAPFSIIPLWSRADFTPIYELIWTLAKEREGMGRNSGENRILAVLRHHNIDYSDALKTRKRWDRMAENCCVICGSDKPHKNTYDKETGTTRGFTHDFDTGFSTP